MQWLSIVGKQSMAEKMKVVTTKEWFPPLLHFFPTYLILILIWFQFFFKTFKLKMNIKLPSKNKHINELKKLKSSLGKDNGKKAHCNLPYHYNFPLSLL
jgi:hypothetical protein